MAKDNYHVVPTEDGWAVRKEGASRVSSHHSTQREAMAKSRSLAQKAGVESVIHGRDGRIRDKDSYGNDPCPPRDAKH